MTTTTTTTITNGNMHITRRRLSDPAHREVDIRKPTKLCALIMYKKYDMAMTRLNTHPDEASIWIRANRTTTTISSLSSSSSSATSSPLVSSSSSRNIFRHLPIHLSCLLIKPEVRTIEPLILKLMEVYPLGLSCQDDNGKIPLHIACWKGASVSIIRRMVELYPPSIGMKDNLLRTPLDYNQLSDARTAGGVRDVIMRFHLSKVESSHRINDGRSNGDDYNDENGTGISPSRCMLENPTNDNSNGTNNNNNNAITPILRPQQSRCTLPPPSPQQRHHTPSSSSPLLHPQNIPTRLLRLILTKQFRLATERLDYHPHEASLWITFSQPPPSSSSFSSCDDHHADSLLGSAGNLPLHVAAALLPSSPLDVERLMERLIKIYPLACRCLSQNGRLAIHLACGYGASPRLIKLLLEAYPDSIRMRDRSRRIPLEIVRGLRRGDGGVSEVRRRELLELLERVWEVVLPSGERGSGSGGVVPSEVRRLEMFLEGKEMQQQQQRRRSSLNDIATSDVTVSDESDVVGGVEMSASSLLRHKSSQCSGFVSVDQLENGNSRPVSSTSAICGGLSNNDEHVTAQAYVDKINELEKTIKDLKHDVFSAKVETAVYKKKNQRLVEKCHSLKLLNLAKASQLRASRDISHDIITPLHESHPTINDNDHDIDDYPITKNELSSTVYNLEAQNEALMRVIGSMGLHLKYIEEGHRDPQRKWRAGIVPHDDFDNQRVMDELRQLLAGRIHLDAPIQSFVSGVRFENELLEEEEEEEDEEEEDKCEYKRREKKMVLGFDNYTDRMLIRD